MNNIKDLLKMKDVLLLKIKDVLDEASISVACILDDIAVDEINNIKISELQKDVEHIQDQITILENYYRDFVYNNIKD